MKLKVLDLFSGIGGFSLGLERTGHYETIAFCEIDKYCKLLLQKHWKGVKIYDDVKEITKERLEADGIQIPEIITGGIPCQPFSVAGKQKGTSDDRHLWPEMFRIIKAFKSRFVIVENVRGLINIQDGVVFETVHTDLESQNYETQTFIIPAAGVGAPHRRDRVWVIAHLANAITGNVEAGRERRGSLRKGHQREGISDHVASGSEAVANLNREERNQSEDRKGSRTQQGSEAVANSSSGRRASQEREIQTGGNSSQHQGWWNFEPDVGRVADGLPGRIHRLKGLGNAIVPQIAEEIGRAIIKAESSKM